MKIYNECLSTELKYEDLDLINGYLSETQKAFDGKLENVFIYHLKSEDQLKREKIGELELDLIRSDYKVLKFFEGEITPAEFEIIKQQRAQWRRQIRTLKN